MLACATLPHDDGFSHQEEIENLFACQNDRSDDGEESQLPQTTRKDAELDSKAALISVFLANWSKFQWRNKAVRLPPSLRTQRYEEIKEEIFGSKSRSQSNSSQQAFPEKAVQLPIALIRGIEAESFGHDFSELYEKNQSQIPPSDETNSTASLSSDSTNSSFSSVTMSSSSTSVSTTTDSTNSSFSSITMDVESVTSSHNNSLQDDDTWLDTTLSDEQVGSSLHAAGNFYLRQDDLNRSAQMFLKAAKTRRRDLGRSSQATKSSLLMAGVVLFAKREYDYALPIFREVLRLSKDDCTCQNDLSKVGRMQNNLGCVLSELGHYSDALEAFNAALYTLNSDVWETYPISKRHLLRVSLTLCNLGFFHMKWRQYDHAKEILLEALSIQRLIHGETHSQVLATKSYLDHIDSIQVELSFNQHFFDERKMSAEQEIIAGKLSSQESGFYLFRS